MRLRAVGVAGAVTGVGALDVARFRKTLHTHSLTNFQHICVLSFSQCALHVLISTFCAARCVLRVTRSSAFVCAFQRVAQSGALRVACSRALLVPARCTFFFILQKERKAVLQKKKQRRKRRRRQRRERRETLIWGDKMRRLRTARTP